MKWFQRRDFRSQGWEGGRRKYPWPCALLTFWSPDSIFHWLNLTGSNQQGSSGAQNRPRRVENGSGEWRQREKNQPTCQDQTDPGLTRYRLNKQIIKEKLIWLANKVIFLLGLVWMNFSFLQTIDSWLVNTKESWSKLYRCVSTQETTKPAFLSIQILDLATGICD